MGRRRVRNILGPLAILAFLLMGCGLLPGQAEVQIELRADDQVVPPGGCTVLHWQVEGAGEYPIFLNGERVDASGDEEVCLEGTQTFELVVGAPGGPHEETVTIQVEGEALPQEPPPGEEPPLGEEPQEPAPPEGGVEAVVFEVHPGTIPPGGCAILFWEIVPPAEWPVFLNGEPVPPVGEREECPEATMTYELLVEAPGGPQERSVTLHVEGEPEPPPPPEPTQPPPQATTPPPPPTQQPPQQPTPTATATTAVPPGGGQWGILTADLAITDLYPDKLKDGTVYGRFTNRGGPDSLNNITVRVSCQWAKTAYGETLGLMESMGPRNMTIVALNPNQTITFSTNIKVDLTQYWYNMTCTVDVDFKDPNLSNNSYNEKLAQ